MKIEAPEGNKIVIRLTADDLMKLHITYEEMDYANIETRRVIWTLLDEARKELGRDIDPSGRMLIEALPAREGGCVLRFTVLQQTAKNQQSHVSVRRNASPLIYEFADAQLVLDAAAAVRRLKAFPVESELYQQGGRYRLIVSPAGENELLPIALTEFGTLCAQGELPAAITREHWREVCRAHALERISPPPDHPSF
ncbi:MAG TPA: adaptor protein MecA [Candidatus Fimivicinus intestinavium]|nr:adaptor protein MecA [Candidatus Fimivicinus intestinavium]